MTAAAHVIVPAVVTTGEDSGSGKSSLVRAGLVPALRNQGRSGGDRWLVPGCDRQVFVLTPTARPLDALAGALLSERVNGRPEAQRALFLDELSRDPHGRRRFLARSVEHAGPTVLVVDQFEELFTLCRSSFEREAFAENLLVAADAGGPARVVIALRADFYAHCAQFASLRKAVASTRSTSAR
jgi:hypothetical protein